jgi:porin
VEVYYRLQLTAVVTVTPDVQVLIDPAFNPNADVVAVFGMRLRIAF